MSLGMTVLCAFNVASLYRTPNAAAKDIQKLPHEPKNPKILQVYFNTTDKREYIFNGEEWVPHDASIDTYVLKKYKKPKNNGNPKESSASSNTSNAQGAPI
jgi:hypothetical protein